MAARPPVWQPVPHPFSSQKLGVDVPGQVVRYSDVNYFQPAQHPCARKLVVAELWVSESDREISTRACGIRLTGIGIHPGGHVEDHDRQSGVADSGAAQTKCNFLDCTFQRPGLPRPEDRVDDQSGSVQLSIQHLAFGVIGS